MASNVPFGLRLTRAILNEHTAITVLLGVLGFALGLGFTVSKTYNPNYTFLLELAPFWQWALVFFAYASSKILGVLYRTPFFVKALTTISGLWLWNYIFLSFIVFDKTPVAATELMLIVPVICEVWGFTNTIYNSKHKLSRRSSDGC